MKEERNAHAPLLGPRPAPPVIGYIYRYPPIDNIPAVLPLPIYTACPPPPPPPPNTYTHK